MANPLPPSSKADMPGPYRDGDASKVKAAAQGDASSSGEGRTFSWSLPRWVRATALGSVFALLVLATWWAARQAPHPDMFRPVGLWDVGRLEWWAHPLERNAFKRRVVHGDLHAVYALPADDRRVWAVGSGGLILHSPDGGRRWVQQRPASNDPTQQGKPIARTSSLWPQAHAAAAEDPSARGGALPVQRALPPQQQQQQQPPQQQPPQQQPPEQQPPQQQPPQQQPPQQQQQQPPQQQQQQLQQQQQQQQPSPTPEAQSQIPAVTVPQDPRSDAAATPKAADPKTPDAPASVPVNPDTATLWGVHFADTRRGWAVGEGGTILATTDGGATWAVQGSGTTATLRGVDFLAGGRAGWVVGDNGAILATDDSGRSWRTQRSDAGANLLGVGFSADGKRGWAVGDGASILATADGGMTWRDQGDWGASSRQRSTMLPRWLTGLAVNPDGRRAWVVGDAGTIVATMDGGINWQAQSAGTDRTLLGVAFEPDGLRGWVVGDGGVVLRTDDAGYTWREQANPTGATLRRVAVGSAGAVGWIVGHHGTLLATRDAGASWQPLTAGARAELQDLAFAADGARGWAVGGDGTILGTTDGGRHWVPARSGSQVHLHGVAVDVDGRRGWAVGHAGTILATTDAGRSWSPQEGDLAVDLRGVTFLADGLRGWVVGDQSSVQATPDGGRTWSAQGARLRTPLSAIAFDAGGQQGWAVGPGGVAGTSDGGTTWPIAWDAVGIPSARGGFPAPGARGVAVDPSGARAWVVGEQGTIYASTDGGINWARRDSNTRSTLQAVSCHADGRRCWAVGDKGSIVASADGGQTWQSQTSGADAYLSNVVFHADGRRGWVVGGGGTVLATLDGGTRWEGPAQHRIYWAPWYFALLVLCGGAAAFLIAFVRPMRAGQPATYEVPTSAGAATTLSSDDPVADKAADLLGYKAAVEALSSFIRNRATEPRVTIAVSGPWGSGKSSIMRMLQTDLQHAGFRTTWFNAWHHQQEGRPLAALFNAIRQQAVPQWWRQPLAALRIRSRLIWGRGGFYRVVSIVAAVGVCLLAGDLLGHDGVAGAWQRLTDNFRYHVLQEKPTYLSRASLARLDPMADSGTPLASRDAGSMRNTCAQQKDGQPQPDAAKLRPVLFCALALHLVPDSEWRGTLQDTTCRVRPTADTPALERCVFATSGDLLQTIEHPEGLGQALTAAERSAILAAAQTREPQPLFRWFQSSLLGGVAGFVLLLFTKGVSVYGLQLLAPAQGLLGRFREDGGKEATGTVERYRAEFRLLCDALDGRLVVFIDDLDRCTPETVNGMLELTNYLMDVGRCFVVLGAAMDRVKRCVRSPVANDDHDQYATEYLRKLVHVELPVPPRRTELGRLMEPQSAAPRRVARELLLRRGLVAAAAVLAMVTLGLSFLAGQQLQLGVQGRAVAVDRQVLAAVPVAPPVRTPPRVGSTDRPEALDPARGGQVGLEVPADSAWPWAALLAALAVVAAAVGWTRLRRYRSEIVVALGGAIRDVDSVRFMDALRLWKDVVVHHDPTPRQVKRFYNRARLLAAYEQQWAQQHAVPQDAIADQDLVALAATYHVEPGALGDMAALARKRGGELSMPVVGETFAGHAEMNVVVSAYDAHRQHFGALPRVDEIERFGALVAGIHVR